MIMLFSTVKTWMIYVYFYIIECKLNPCSWALMLVDNIFLTCVACVYCDLHCFNGDVAL